MNSAAPGWFGKLPSLGDFASRRLPAAFVHGWDEWLQLGLASAREALGEHWLDDAGLGPRRFWVGAGVLGAAGWAGLITPSRDRVGRRFPLTIAAALAPPGSLAGALASRAWFDAIDTVARRAVSDALTVDELEGELERASATAPLAAAGDATAASLAAALLRGFGGARGEPCSVWWRDDARDLAAFACVAALPPPAAFASLLGARDATLGRRGGSA
jgi:type VI secretion system protein ImpM